MLEDKGNTAIYLLYAYTRIKSIARNCGGDFANDIKKVLETTTVSVTHEKEWKLTKVWKMECWNRNGSIAKQKTFLVAGSHQISGRHCQDHQGFVSTSFVRICVRSQHDIYWILRQLLLHRKEQTRWNPSDKWWSCFVSRSYRTSVGKVLWYFGIEGSW